VAAKYTGPVIVGSYELHAAIASGGTATVHLGRRRGAAGFKRVVAIKRMHPHLAEDVDFIEMFLDEARLASGVRHANVVPIVDVVTDEGELMLVMEYVAGVSVVALVRDLASRGERIPIPIAMRIAYDSLQGLHAAHTAIDDDGNELRIVHRDVTPHNLIVGKDGVTRVVDFGIAKGAGRMHATRTGLVKGKLGYLPPEQLAGDKNVDQRADVYGLGVTLWEMLGGRRPQDAPSEEELMFMAVSEDIQPVSEVVEGIPPFLDEVVLRATRRKRIERFQTARDMAQALMADALPLATVDAVSAWLASVAERKLRTNEERATAVRTAAVVNDEQTTKKVAVPAARDRTKSALTHSTARRVASRRSPLRTVASVLFVGGLVAASFFLGRTDVPIDDANAAEAPAGPGDGARLPRAEPPAGIVDPPTGDAPMPRAPADPSASPAPSSAAPSTGAAAAASSASPDGSASAQGQPPRPPRFVPRRPPPPTRRHSPDRLLGRQ
jgi:serine/threonine-protein kinase